MPQKSERLLACEVLQNLLQHQGSLASLLNSDTLGRANSPALLQEFCYGVCRWHPRLAFYLERLLDKPLRTRDQDIHCLLLIALYQLLFMRTPDHASVNEWVETVAELGKDWAKSLVNAVLRSALRRQDELLAAAEKDYSVWYAHPQWLLDRLKKDWPQRYREILDGNNHRAPMTLRVNAIKATRQQCVGLLASAGTPVTAGTLAPYSLYLSKPVDTAVLPGFAEGIVSVQDEASQMVSTFMPLAQGLRVLDACAAPGGKTCALLEAEPSLNVLALDNESRRLPRIQQNLDRLQLRAEVRCADITASTVGLGSFDRILLDVPCSATGVIRRHPDIKVLRTPDEVESLVGRQRHLLDAAWPLLNPGGYLLYSTCSVLNCENAGQISNFVDAHNDAEVVPISVAVEQPCSIGLQLFPQRDGNDGFYYALLRKRNAV
jgi:16S rRNA (cytosine967-C5)-methyltransferase